ncbi:COG4223 family protein [Belnapia rosea]|uniref:COG4223 family protein n=1 Tax=Belnapia rosea TaxID=938405 RepID=UPI000886B1AB|nr:hypothetical protein [Belnapia rosea]SDB31264.1 hypothetical protein SAMN02927895_01078 [Belnapia rosea]
MPPPPRPATPPPPSPPPTPRNSPLDQPAPRPLLSGRVDPAAVVIGVGGLVLLVAVWWLLVTPRSSTDNNVDSARVAQIEQRLTALDGLRGEVGALNGRIQQVQPLEARIRSLEERPVASDTRPLETRLASVTEQVAAAERAGTQAAERDNAMERRLQGLEAKPTINPAAFAPRDAVEGLSGRIERLTERVEQQGQALDSRLQDQARAAEGRLAAQDKAVQDRVAALEASVGQRVAGLEGTLGERIGALESALGGRVAALEAAQQRLQAIESRTSRLAAVDSLRGALTAGQPLGEALGRIDQPPQALARFAGTAPPTESSLRLSFEDAAKAARAASDAAMQPDGSRAGVVDSALSRLGGLVTIRRGDQVVWGDAAEAEIERARRALEAGDIEMSLQHIDKLPPPARAAMQGWADQARALLAARAALRQLAAG